MTDQKSNQPVTNVREGAVSLAVFDNQYGLSAVLQKSYKKETETDWHTSQINLFMNEIEKVKKVVDQVYEKHLADIEKAKK